MMDQRTQEGVAGLYVGTLARRRRMNGIECLRKPVGDRLRQGRFVQAGSSEHRQVKDDIFVRSHFLEPIDGKGRRRVQRPVRVQGVVLVASVKNADGARCGFLQPVSRSRAHAQTDPDRQKVRRQRAGERNLAIDQAAAEEHMVTMRKGKTAGQRGARHLCRFETGAVDRIPQILKRGNRNTSPPSRGQK